MKWGRNSFVNRYRCDSSCISSEMLSCFYDCEEQKISLKFMEFYHEILIPLVLAISPWTWSTGLIICEKKKIPSDSCWEWKKKVGKIQKEFTFLLLYTLSFYIYFLLFPSYSCKQNFSFFFSTQKKEYVDIIRVIRGNRIGILWCEYLENLI